MFRRDLLKSFGVAAAGGAGGLTLTQAQAEEAEPLSLGFGPYAAPWNPADAAIPGRQNVVPVSDDYFIPGRFEGKTVIVTGSARGMGEVAARRLAREGANVVGVDILEDLGASVVDKITAEGGNAVFLGGDIAEDSVCAEMVRLAVDTYGGLDGAINNAGVMDALFPDEPIDYVNQTDRVMARIDEAGDEYWDRVIKVNVYGTFYSLRHEIGQMIEQGRGGSIVNVACVAGIRGFGGTVPYVASKHAVQGLTKTAAIDAAAYGIRVNSVGMGTTVTPMFERAFQIIDQRRATGYADTGIGLYKSMSLLQYSDQAKRGSTSAEQVAIMLFLLSQEASNITGSTYNTDGGFTIF
ncbi:dehydrogenase [Rhodosalinus halophilus]|uniref:Dehydrogenase n=1 Tax=Rhodosalinus halophilus TaxID=2259333 RepID=A0A365UD47_9RHOB|nr:SDR family NAD(P)-dependent oxidoreductase [Rhodosalinus halophilus]RBI87431.1 dehydrogenase [Rhodosalinus halophilus]